VEFDDFAATAGPRLRATLLAAFGPEVGLDAAAEALAYGWEHWARLSTMDNPAGYLFRVGQTAARRTRRREGFLPVPEVEELPNFEPALIPAIEALSEQQRVCVLLVHALGWSQVEVAGVLGVDPATVRTHLGRALTRLRAALEVAPDAP
jgi:DNA-directed RNA polymerase specialized sigma24 family protein